MIDGSMAREIFDIYVEIQLAPTLRPSDVAILDHLPPESEKAREILKMRGTSFLVLPPHGPDMNAIDNILKAPSTSSGAP